MEEKTGRKPYETPQVKEWGAVADLTRVGFTQPGADVKGGSVTPKGKGP
jgi:hypothetical protein